MALLLTLPLDTPPVCPLPRLPHADDETQPQQAETDSTSGISKEEEEEGERALFRSISLEDYAWRVYHERLLLKDPLDRYRI